MKLNNSSELLLPADPLLSSAGQHKSPPSRKSKSSAFGGAVTTAVNMAGAMYSPILKVGAGKAEPAVSRIHCIPLVMLLVFVILWAASSEEQVLPDVKLPTISNQLRPSELELKTASAKEINPQHGGRIVLQQQQQQQQKQSALSATPDALGDKFQDGTPAKAHLRGNARSVITR